MPAFPPPGPGGPGPMGPPPGPMGLPPGPEATGPSPEELDQLITMLLTLPPEALQQVVAALNAEVSAPEGGPPEEVPGPGGPGEPGPGALREAATARAGL